ncbi:zinc finger protein OZF-like isoform X2 [Danaus plexippus]|nr:zinc finger protein OZF-like isoform X2 [Danaus plexippus]
MAFRQQVLKCEEAFLQVKIYDEKENHAEEQKIEVEVKLEPEEISNETEMPKDALADESQTDNEIKPDMATNAPNEDIPLQEIVTEDEDNKLDKINVEALPKRFKTMKRLSAERSKIPMSKLQQRMRERDPTYITETNILTIVEFSYACPFKCRHNHLLCFYCGQNFSDPQQLRDHTSQFHHPRKFKITDHKNMLKLDLTRIDCRLCGHKTDDLDDFKTHVTDVHKKKYYFNVKDLMLPFKLSKDEFKCALCDVIFPYFHALNKHMNEHFSNYVCETCGLGFVDRGRFLMHQQRHEEGDFPCEVCGKVFKAQYNKELHIDRVHKKKGRVYCPKCDVRLMNYPQKLKHLVEVHGEEPLSFSCNMCDKVCETRRKLTIHRRKEHLKDYRYECQCCGQKFFTRFALTNHMPTHTGERNFKCKVCEKTYPRLKTLKDHLRIHTNDRRYRCHICGQAFIQNCSLKGHMKSQHPEYS